MTQLQEHALSSPPGTWLPQLAFYVQELQLGAAVGLLLRCIISSNQVRCPSWSSCVPQAARPDSCPWLAHVAPTRAA